MDDDAACGVHRAVPVVEVVGAPVAAVAVVLLLLPDGAEMLLVSRPSPALLGVNIALAGDEEETAEDSGASAAAAVAGAATPLDSGRTAASAGGGFDGGGEGGPTTPRTLLPSDLGAAAAAAAVVAEKSAMLPIMYSDTTRGSTEAAGSRMTPSSAECAKALSAEPVPGLVPAVVEATAAAAAAAERAEVPAPATPVRPPAESCREGVLVGGKASTEKRNRTVEIQHGALGGREGRGEWMGVNTEIGIFSSST